MRAAGERPGHREGKRVKAWGVTSRLSKKVMGELVRVRGVAVVTRHLRRHLGREARRGTDDFRETTPPVLMCLAQLPPLLRRQRRRRRQRGSSGSGGSSCSGGGSGGSGGSGGPRLRKQQAPPLQARARARCREAQRLFGVVQTQFMEPQLPPPRRRLGAVQREQRGAHLRDVGRHTCITATHRQARQG